MTSKFKSLTNWSLAALAAGLGLGLLAHRSGLPMFAAIGTVANAIGAAWLGALQLIVLPLVIALLLAAVGNGRGDAMGSLGLRALFLFVAVLVAVGIINFLAIPPLLAHYRVDPAAMAALNAGVTIPPAALAAGTGASWPRNIFEAAVRGQLFPLLLFAIIFALAVARLPEEQRGPATRALQTIADTMMIVVQWLLAVTPLGVFALSYGIARRTGDSLLEVIGFYLVLQVSLTAIWVLLFYPLSAAAGRVSLRIFARAVLPAQIVAVTTRSSAAALPALVDGARRNGLLSPLGTTFALPFSVSFFRISEVILNPVKLLFLAHVYGVTLHPAGVAAFFATVCLFSVIGAGTPDSGGGIGFRMVPVFVAAGIPIEGVMILEAVETIPDMFATLANVTSQMGASVVLAGAEGGDRPA